jgi:hypothetical protein
LSAVSISIFLDNFSSCGETVEAEGYGHSTVLEVSNAPVGLSYASETVETFSIFLSPINSWFLEQKLKEATSWVIR